MLSKRSFLYRFIGITFAFLLLGSALFVPLIITNQEKDQTVNLILLIVYASLYVLTLVGNEIYIAIRKKKNR